jgi:hypothetical protein
MTNQPMTLLDVAALLESEATNYEGPFGFGPRGEMLRRAAEVVRNFESLVRESRETSRALISMDQSHGLGCSRIRPCDVDDDHPFATDQWDCGGDCGELAARGMADRIEEIDRDLDVALGLADPRRADRARCVDEAD